MKPNHTLEAPERPRHHSAGARALRAIRLFVRAEPLGAAAGLALVIIVLAALGADLIAGRDPILQDPPNRLRPPSLDYLFGTDGFGRDVFSRVVHAARASLYLAFIAVALGAGLGFAIGLASAYAGGKVDTIIQRVADVLLGFPFLVLALVMVVALGASVNTIAIAIALSLAPQVARLTRSRVLVVKTETYVLAAWALGAGPLRLLWRHILPNSWGPVLAYATGYFGTALVAEATLSFLGLGVPPPDPSWGRMLQEGARQHLEVAPWLTLFPGAALAASAFSFSLLGDALRDVLDPRSLHVLDAFPTRGPMGTRENGHRAAL